MSEGAIQEMPRGVTIICYRSGRFAVSRRTGTKHGRGLWQFPGGHVEPGEMAHDAALRELREETGLVIEQHRLVTLAIVGPLAGYNGKPYLGIRFGVEIRDDEVLEHKEPEKHTPWEWRRPAEVANLDMLRATKEYAYQFALQCLGF